MSIPLLDECRENGKLRAIMPEIDVWWTGFYGDDNSLEMMEENFKEHKFGVIVNMTLMRVQWELGFYRAAGRSFGRFDSLLMGRPKWTANKAITTTEAELAKPKGTGKDLVVFQSLSLDWWMGTKLAKNAEACVIPDDVEFLVMDAAIKALIPYDDFAWMKYFSAEQAMQAQNWSPCQADKELSEVTDKATKEWSEFWAQSDVHTIVAYNVSKNIDAWSVAVNALQENWEAGKFEKAAYFYSMYWNAIMDRDQKK